MDRIARALLAEERERLRLTIRARSAALVAILALVSLLTEWPEMLWFHGLIVIFIATGLLQLRLQQPGLHRDWYKYAFAALDFALLTFVLLYPNPLSELEFPAQMLLRFGSFLYFFVILAGLAFTFHPRLVLWGGICAAVFWTIGVGLIAMRGDSIVDAERAVPPGATAEQRMQAILDTALSPTFVDLGVRLQEVVVFLITAALLAMVVARSRRMVRAQAALERRNANLTRYFPPQLAENLSERDEPFGQQSEVKAAILFTDIVGFAGWAENRSPAEVIELLREAHRRVERAVFSHGGVLDKFIGDGAMATFGAAHPEPDDCRNALACVGAILAEIADWNQGRRRRDQSPVGVSVGLHYGPVVVGDVGSERRMELAVIGDTVNVASRIEHMTRALGAVAAVSQEVIDAAGGPPPGAVCVGPHDIAGRAKPVTLWTLGSAEA
jgi:adenylate cyclase